MIKEIEQLPASVLKKNAIDMLNNLPLSFICNLMENYDLKIDQQDRTCMYFTFNQNGRLKIRLIVFTFQTPLVYLTSIDEVIPMQEFINSGTWKL